MKGLKLRIGLGAIPIVGFFITYVWGIGTVYATDRKKGGATLFALFTLACSAAAATPAAVGAYFAFRALNRSNIAPSLTLILFLCLAGLYCMTAACLAVLYLYSKKSSPIHR